MNFTAGKVAVMMVAAGVALGGCATRESVRNAQASADAADRHAGLAQSRADEAYGVGNNALGVGNGAMSSAQMANQKADLTASDVVKLRKRVAYLEYKTLPHHKKKVRHHHAPAQAPAATDQSRPSNS